MSKIETPQADPAIPASFEVVRAGLRMHLRSDLIGEHVRAGLPVPAGLGLSDTESALLAGMCIDPDAARALIEASIRTLNAHFAAAGISPDKWLASEIDAARMDIATTTSQSGGGTLN